MIMIIVYILNHLILSDIYSSSNENIINKSSPQPTDTVRHKNYNLSLFNLS